MQSELSLLNVLLILMNNSYRHPVLSVRALFEKKRHLQNCLITNDWDGFGTRERRKENAT